MRLGGKKSGKSADVTHDASRIVFQVFNPKLKLEGARESAQRIISTCLDDFILVARLPFEASSEVRRKRKSKQTETTRRIAFSVVHRLLFVAGYECREKQHHEKIRTAKESRVEE